jgi:Na+-translocating ferredoxin:NAD+ oxidoreductase RnfD subunit
MSENLSASKTNKISRFVSNIQFRYVPPVFITIILLTGHFTFGILESYQAILLSVGCAIAIELFLSKLILGKWKNIASAYISGISVSILIRSILLWPFALVSIVSIMSKYLLRYKGRHIWNPSNFGISWFLFFAPASVAGLSIQWGNSLLPMLVIWSLGLFIAIRAKRLHITITYVVGFILFSYLRSLIEGTGFFTEVAPLTGPMYQLFVFFMITDPATTVSSKRGRIIVAFLIALLEFVLRLNEMIYAPFYALFIVGPIAMIFDLRMQSRHKKTSRFVSRDS